MPRLCHPHRGPYVYSCTQSNKRCGLGQQKCDHTLDLTIDGTMHRYDMYTPLRRLKIYFNVQVLYNTLDALFAALAWGLMETPQA